MADHPSRDAAAVRQGLEVIGTHILVTLFLLTRMCYNTATKNSSFFESIYTM